MTYFLQRTPRSGGLRCVSLLALLSALVLTPVAGFAADADRHEDRAESRIKDLHARLHIDAAQEPAWRAVADGMREDAKTMDRLSEERAGKGPRMSALDDLNSYSEITDAHAAGVRHLKETFTPLYQSMSESQKAIADTVFRRGDARAQKPAKVSGDVR